MGSRSDANTVLAVKRSVSRLPRSLGERLSGGFVSPAACQGGSERPCGGNGHCSGDGSRQGDGSCQCHLGYQGATCTDCMDGYFRSLRNETHSVCTGTWAAPGLAGAAFLGAAATRGGPLAPPAPPERGGPCELRQGPQQRVQAPDGLAVCP